jgi:hypothetical protein
MKKIVNLFTEHPRSVGETYCEHFGAASRLSLKLCAASLMQFMHAVFPFVIPPFGTNVSALRASLKEFDPEFRGQHHDIATNDEID